MGGYYTLRLRGLQVSKLKLSLSYLLGQKQEKSQGGIPRYQAVATVLAGNFGTGNISGMAIALSTGGPGALFWMWLMALIGVMIQYASCLLGVKYREKSSSGEFAGGPMYYLKNGAKSPFAAALFAFFVVLGAITVGGLCQMDSINLALQSWNIPTSISAIGVTVAAALVILGGVKRIARFSSSIIPVLALLYLGSCFYILAANLSLLPAAFSLLFSSAFGSHALIGGAAGFSVAQVVTAGVGRALFATDVGTGYVPILQAQSKSQHHVIDGVVALIAPFLVMVVCTVTALVLIVTGAYTTSLVSTSMVVWAFQQHLGVLGGKLVVTLSLLLFGFTTILAWAHCFEKALGYLLGDKEALTLRLAFLVFLPLGIFLPTYFIWTLADLSLVCMTLLNVWGVTTLSKEVIKDSRLFFKERTS